MVTWFDSAVGGVPAAVERPGVPWVGSKDGLGLGTDAVIGNIPSYGPDGPFHFGVVSRVATRDGEHCSHSWMDKSMVDS